MKEKCRKYLDFKPPIFAGEDEVDEDDEFDEEGEDVEGKEDGEGNSSVFNGNL